MGIMVYSSLRVLQDLFHQPQLGGLGAQRARDAGGSRPQSGDRELQGFGVEGFHGLHVGSIRF